MTKGESISAALAKGATMADIEAETALQRRHVGTVPFNNMIRALQLHPWSNTQAEWTRLAAALIAKAGARRCLRK